MDNIRIQTTLEFATIECYKCGVLFAIPKDLQRHLRDKHTEFFCPNGHAQGYYGKSEAEKLMDELKRKEQELSDQVQKRISVQGDLEKAERKLRRVSKGVCPCCNRSFTNLHNHIKKQHPTFKP